jgi:hypothetical protein
VSKYPEKVVISGEVFHYEKVLKDDFFSVNVLYKNQLNVRYVLKLSDFRFVLGLLLRPLAILFSRREYKIYKMLEGIEGIPPLGPRFGRSGYFHRYIEGKTLHEMKPGDPFPEDFFPKLMTIISQLHERRIFYLDLNKRGNIICGEDGRPYLIDFQVSLYFKKRKGFGGRISDLIFKGLIREDIYHFYKHKKNFQKHLLTPEELIIATTRTPLNHVINRYLGTPYRKVKRLIYPHGSNEIIWYRWKKMKDRSKRMP